MSIRLVTWGVVLVGCGLLLGCSDDEPTSVGGGGGSATGVGGSGAAGATGGSGGSGGTSSGGGGGTAICGNGDGDRIFFNDFEDGTYRPGSNDSLDPSRHFVFRGGSGAYSDEANFAVVGDGATPDTRTGAQVLRGNFWELVDPNDPNSALAVDPAADAGGVTIYGTKRPSLSVALSDLGIPQMPPTDPNEPIAGRGEIYVSFWLWYDQDFTHESTVGNQGVKLFYAFGPNHVEWVLSEWDSATLHLHMNINNLGAWPDFDWLGGFTAFNGRWAHLEWYFLEESAPVFYEYGQFSNPSAGYLASDCPGVDDYTVQFPVPGTQPQQCLTPEEAYAQNSRDGIFIARIDGQTIVDVRDMAYNGRFGLINFPAWHGGGGQALSSAGWALDDVCLRRNAPPGWLE